MTQFSRRSTIALLATGTLAPLTAGAVMASATSAPKASADFADVLAKTLNEKWGSACDGQFSVTKVDFDHAKGNASAVVRLDWAPGMRQRVISGVGQSEDQILIALVDACEKVFSFLGKAA